MKAARIHSPNTPYQIDEIPIPVPGAKEVQIQVRATSLCHGDVVAKFGVLPGIPYPITPGHEVAGVITQIGELVMGWKVGDRVGTGWYGQHCFECEACRDGDFVMCEKQVIHGGYKNGGFAEYMVVNQEALARIPEGMEDEDAAPLMCAGLTVWSGLVGNPVDVGSICVVQGIGGLGHLGIQYAAKMGYNVVAVSRGEQKREMSLKLGASVYIDSEAEDAVEIIKGMGGAGIILCTAPNSQAIADISAAAKRNGKIIVLSVPHDPIPINAGSLLLKRISMHFWTSGVAKTAEGALNFAALHNIKPMLQIYPLEEIESAFDSMMDSSIQFRACIKMH